MDSLLDAILTEAIVSGITAIANTGIVLVLATAGCVWNAIESTFEAR